MDIQDHSDVDRKENKMKKLSENEMKQIKAGSISGTLWNAIVKGFTSISDLGRYAGSAIRRLIGRNLCGF